ncbi:hypothetical protein AAFF_G00103870 [Aldrovandia affinis]|uniref:Secreted protein n=1 Tax=Aldrovandia affinis TaxID=143900 RepID=A0AAD7RU91_9TELE|nr:hypothetical protein AAFF_G00103870 [Aldrovandia affinis]
MSLCSFPVCLCSVLVPLTGKPDRIESCGTAAAAVREAGGRLFGWTGSDQEPRWTWGSWRARADKRLGEGERRATDNLGGLISRAPSSLIGHFLSGALSICNPPVGGAGG